ncbi:MAG: M1 family peptidase [Deltaproteobacteria bacterium]|nr:M1 family peptidase [Deltaproteobacteria bacterium]
MRRETTPFPRLALICLLVLPGGHGIAGAPTAMGSSAHHDLSISLFPERSELEGRDRIRIERPESGSVEFSLSPRARIQSVRIDGREHPYTFARGRLTLNRERNESTPNGNLDLHYTCRFDDPAPVRPVNTDNPGFGVSGTISAVGTFILSGAGWYPQMTDAHESFNLYVDGPADTVAVTAGRLLGIEHQENRTLSRWRIDNPLEGLSLSAGPYVVEQQTLNGMTAATYLFSENQQLAPRYLEASLRYLKRYSDLFGAYPFDSFAVVENFFPTGYGFPAYTLMGSDVLRLPFIPETSLPHEIVHNWWGNGVLVDFASGNWCEGLTSYTADYLNREQASPDAATDYRRQALRNYASLVSPATDFSLSRFQSRTDPATKAVGYDKSAMVFHMLRKEVGDAAFWAALRDLYRGFLFQRASWQDLRQIFENRAGRSLTVFFRQWVEQPGAPQIRLEDVRREAGSHGYRTSGRLAQKKPYYELTLKLALDTEGGSIEQTIHLTGRQSKFEIPSDTRPRVLTADPDYEIFRQLSPEEIPPTVNTLKGSTAVVLVIAKRLGRVGRPIARYFAQAMGLEPIRTIDEADFSAADAAGNDLLFIGLPENPESVDLLPRDPALAADAFELEGQRFDGASDVLFFVVRHPYRSENVVALLHPLSPDAADQASVKIPHYGRYSYLVFSDGRNRVKGTWDAKTSPLTVRWDPKNP